MTYHIALATRYYERRSLARGGSIDFLLSQLQENSDGFQQFDH